MLIPALATAALAAQDAAAPSRFDLDPLSHDHLTNELHVLADTHAHAALVSIGRSAAGRAIEGVRLGTDPDAPAILLVANLSGPRTFATAVALDHARRLAAGYATDERVRALLDATTVIVLPCANPDAAELCVEALAGDRPRFEHTAAPVDGVDDDRDGRSGEDGPADVDGDGVIAWMRFADPDATWRADPTDDRALVEADRAKAERATWRLAVEGRDADGDERVAEDPPHDAEVAHNFAAGWEQYAPAAGRFPTALPEARALCDLCVTTPEIALVVTYDALDSLVETPDTVADDARPVKRVPPPGVLASDGELLEELGRRYRDALEARDVPRAAAADGADDAGTFQRFAYAHRGLLTLDTVLWDLPESDPAPPEEEEAPDGEEAAAEAPPAEEAEPSADAKRLAWIDAQGPEEAWRFVPWTPFEHPELGPVEIGGLAPFARLQPPAGAARAIADAHYEHLLTLGAVLARVAVAECTLTPVGAGVWRLEAAVENDGYLPLFTRSGRRTETARPARLVPVLPDAAELVAGPRHVLVEDLPGSGGRHEAEWLVRGPEGMEVGVRVDSDHAGSDERKAEVAR